METLLKSFTKNVAASGTPEPLQQNRLASDFIKIKAKSTNTKTVSIGDSSSQDFELAAGIELSLNEVLEKNGGCTTLDLAKIYCKVQVNGEGVEVLYALRPSAGL